MCVQFILFNLCSRNIYKLDKAKAQPNRAEYDAFRLFRITTREKAIVVMAERIKNATVIIFESSLSVNIKRLRLLRLNL